MLVTVLPDDGVAVPMVAAGRDFTLALRADGTVWAWGDNTAGFLGVDPNYQYILQGVVIVVAIALDIRKYIVKK